MMETTETTKRKGGAMADSAPVETVRLKNGTEHLKSWVAVMQMTLKRLLNEKPGVFYDLVSLCRNAEHPITWSATIDELHGGGLIEKTYDPDAEAPAYFVPDAVREVVLSAVEGDGLDMRLVSPIAS